MKKSLKWWQWETLLVTMGGYALYYVIRKNLSIAMPLLGEIGVSKVQLGAFLTAGGIVYGLGRFLNGIVADRNSARKVMAIGLFICSFVNVLFGLSDFLVLGDAAPAVKEGAAAATALVWTMGIIWIVNQYFQGMGVGPCIKTLPKWFPPEELSTKQSIWNLSHSVGAGAVFALCGWLLIPAFHAWRLCFIVPAAIAAVGGVAVLFLFKDSPEDVGLSLRPTDHPSDVLRLASKEDIRHETQDERTVETQDETAAATQDEAAVDYRAYVTRWVFRNPRVWIIAIADFFVYTVRFAALDWGIVLLMETKGLSLASATTLCFVFEIVGGNLGMVVAGWATDRFFNSCAHRTSVFCMAGAAVSIAAFWAVPPTMPLVVKLLPFMMIGFFIYGPQALLGVATTQQATPRAAGVAGGFVGIFSYASTILSGIGFGFVAQQWGWNAAYATILAAAFVGGCVLLLMWRAGAEAK
jgi:OPA family glycerol-3-phosphate transporter-like MFS transporter/OPA family sugar phosphate sensor protein UhpC-like MFS transporter